MAKRRNEDAPFWRQMEESERRIIQHALDGATSIRRAAEALGVSESFLIGRVKKLKLKAPDHKQRPRKQRGPKPKAPNNVVPLKKG